jgi:hypothetical protein
MFGAISNRFRDQGSTQVNGAVSQFFADDHRRLDALLSAAIVTPGQIDLPLFGIFCTRLLRHIGMEEKLLFPALRAALGGSPLPLAAKLRVDHGALAALLVPTPTTAVIEDILSILVPHNRRGEGANGVYHLCDNALSPTEARRLLEQARAFPEVRVNPYNDGPKVMRHIEMHLRLARRQWVGAVNRDR